MFDFLVPLEYMFMSGKNHYFLLMSYYLGTGVSLSQSSVKEFSIHSVMNELITHAFRVIPSFLVDNIVGLRLISVLKMYWSIADLQHCVSFRHIIK